MSDRKFLITLLITALIAIVTISWTAAPRDPHLPKLVYEDAHSKSFKPTSPDCEKAAIDKLTENKRPQKLYACASAQEEYRLSVNDLVQQTRAADAAQAQSGLALTTAWLAFAQTIGGILTLIAAFAAAKFARDAAVETKRSADAAHDELDHAKEMTKIQLRPHISLLNAELLLNENESEKENTPYHLKMTFKNFGQTGANECHERSGWTCDGESREVVINEEVFEEYHSLAPSDQLVAQYGLSIDKELNFDFISGNREIHYFGEMNYVDEFGYRNDLCYFVRLHSGEVVEFYTTPATVSPKKSTK